MSTAPRPVNLASRMTDVAKPGTVVATESIHDQTPDLAWKRKRSRRLKGVDGRVRVFSLDPPEDPPWCRRQGRSPLSPNR
jgi:class 3 adenylate cyclase